MIGDFNYNKFICKCKKFHEKETRDLTYVMARYIIKKKPQFKHEAIRLLLADWNRRHIVKFTKKINQLNNQLIKDINEAMESLDELNKHAEVFSKKLNEIDLENGIVGKTIENAFWIFNKKDLIAGVGAAKSLHLLYPDIFVLWDSNIYSGSRRSPSNYLKFMKKIKNELLNPLLENKSEEKIWEDHYSQLDERVQHFYSQIGFKEPLLKMIDEYNYIKAKEKASR